MTCKRAQGFLATRKVTLAEEVDAKRAPIDAAGALRLLKGARHLYAARRKTVVHLDLVKDAPSRAELLALVLGPTGNLRAPTIRRGDTIIVGFDEATFARSFG